MVFRKSMRRGRALLSLFRDDLPKETYRATRQSLGVAARSVSTLRDAEMFVGLVENLELTEAQRELARRATARSDCGEDELFVR